MTTTPTSGAADLLDLIEAYAEARRRQGHSSYNAQTATALQAVKDALAAGQATAAQAQPAAQQPHRSGCTAGTDEACVQRGCGTNCPAVSPQTDSVQEDAALWHWLAEYLVGTRTDLDDEIVASETVNDLRKLVESAIKQGEKQ